MKRRAMCVVCLILYILAACTCLSLKIEEEMRLEADGMTVKGLGMWGQNIEIPMTALFEDAYGYHLYEVVEGTGWESGLRVSEVSPQRYAVDFTNQTVRHSGGEDHVFCSLLGALLGQMVSPQEIHHMGENRRGHIVQQRRHSLLFITGKMPHNQRRPQGMIKPGIGLPMVKQREGGILAAAVHPHALQPLHKGRFGSLRQKSRYFIMINSQKVHTITS